MMMSFSLYCCCHNFVVDFSVKLLIDWIVMSTTARYFDVPAFLKPSCNTIYHVEFRG
jgi:hypothetical protein